MTATAALEQPALESLLWAEPIRTFATLPESGIEMPAASANEALMDDYENLYFVPD